MKLTAVAMAVAATLALSSSNTLVSAGSSEAVVFPPGQGRATRGIRSVITGQKIRSHGHHSRRSSVTTDFHANHTAADDDFDEADHTAFEKRVSAKSCTVKTGKHAKAHRAHDSTNSKLSKGSTSTKKESKSSSDSSKASSDKKSSSSSKGSDGSSKTDSSSSSLSSSSSKSSSSSSWSSSGLKLVKSYSGSSFFDDMFFFTGNDPTNGMVDYVSKSDASNQGLTWTKGDQAGIKIAHPSSGHAKSVRISTQDSFTTGLFILDAEHMPVGCGLWPAWWSTPENPAGGWPNGGEIDIIEGVNDFSLNTYSIHSTSGCNIVKSALDMVGTLTESGSTATNCASLETDNKGCGVSSKTKGDFGVDYNAGNGGVHAMHWDDKEGISMYFFKRGKIPSDITSGSPNPSSWGTPQATWPATHCDMSTFFWNHVVVFSNTVCGTWAGSSAVWNQAMKGQSESCAAQTGHSSCESYINSNPSFDDAYWTINSLKIYQTSRKK